MDRIRTFVAVEISPAVRGRAGDLVNRLRASGVKASWTRPENMHLTLQFLGDTDETLLPDVCRRVQEAAAGFSPFTLTFGRAGAFPSARRPRTLWLGVTEGLEPIRDLQAAIEKSLRKLGFRGEHRQYQPHLTLGRVREGGPPAALAELIAANSDFDAGACEIDEVLVFSSQLEPAGPIYGVLGRAPLRGA